MRKGFTLVELIIYLAIVSTLATSLILWSLTVGDLDARARSGATLNTSARFALQIIARDLEQATTVVSPFSAAPSSVLILTDSFGQPVNISISNGQLVRKVGGINPLPLTALPATVTNFTVARTTGPWSARASLSVALTLSALPAPARTFTTVINLRR
jgi:prepilin-type N-terminal cleavage/methylation domain-containing protein